MLTTIREHCIKSKVVKLYYLIRAALELTRQDVRIFSWPQKSPLRGFGLRLVYKLLEFFGLAHNIRG